MIDDPKTEVKILSRLLSQNECEPIVAGDAESGLQLARQYPPDLIFLDIPLPGMHGLAALRRLPRPGDRRRACHHDQRRRAVGGAHGLGRLGSDDFMKKPFDCADVFARIEALVRTGRLPARSQPSAFDWNAL